MKDTRYNNDLSYRENKLQYMREYQRRLRDLARTNPEDPRAKKFIEYRRKYQRERERELRKKAERIFGKCCFLCSYSKTIQYHEIHGKRHVNSPKFAIEHKGDFVALCRVCHSAVHQFMKVFRLKWKDILALKSLVG